MNPTLKAVFLFVSFVLLCGLIFYSITVYDKWETRKQDREDRLAEHDRENDSLTLANQFIQAQRDSLLLGIGNNKELIKANHKYYTDKTKQDLSKPAAEQNKILIDLIEK